ncbi:short neuropeptide F precursor [Rhodnius prolixus]|uniref:short neuropeptide F precursor n=1 Tax=Rhodnius prolixus TaxID=13249 RepID=UPI003D18ACAD
MKIALSALCCLIAVALMFTPETTSAPAIQDYDSMRDLYELLLQREALPDSWAHKVVRKNNRSPQLRLRFGRRNDPTFLQGDHLMDNSMIDTL